MNTEHTKKAEVLRALGHPIRYCIVEGLLSESDALFSVL